MKILILSGFLGSGKTTALMSLARYMVDHAITDR
ncbi:MAG: cobalamin biosynthesis protein P47K, partial [Clostridiales bacterium]|nr:cobalamin biosynthesis protein P47K [Clostridiales bacterium]